MAMPMAVQLSRLIMQLNTDTAAAASAAADDDTLAAVAAELRGTAGMHMWQIYACGT